MSVWVWIAMILEICSTFYYFTRISPLNCQPRTESETLITNYKRFVFLGYIKTKSQNRKIAFNGHLLVIGVQTKIFSILCVIWIFWQKCMLAQPSSKEESWICRWELLEGRKRPASPHESRLETRLSISTAMCKELLRHRSLTQDYKCFVTRNFCPITIRTYIWQM